ncbi:hypothetical protein ABE438_04980 [Bosea sp. TWI1241]|uniref:hypothetical protein n=1 Tax=Bosea sp. TWI1241 TaxID=3148904 RepID=UPI00320A5D6F
MNHIELAGDTCENPLVRVQLAKTGDSAVLYLTDYARVLTTIGTASWFLDSNGQGKTYVRAWHPTLRRNVMISRLVLGSEQGAVRHKDGDSLNLCRENLTRPLRRAPKSAIETRQSPPSTSGMSPTNSVAAGL